jgi:hypothetical protein
MSNQRIIRKESPGTRGTKNQSRDQTEGTPRLGALINRLRTRESSCHESPLPRARRLVTVDEPKLPSIPAEPIAKKKEPLFSYDFELAELGKDQVRGHGFRLQNSDQST